MIGGVEYITVCSDASVWDGKSGFAYYIRDDTGVTARAWHEAGHRVNYSHQAEVEAMMGALRIISDRNYQHDTKLIYYCDSLFALWVLSDSFTSATKRKKWTKYIDECKYLTRNISRIEVRHVKGHVSAGEYGVEEKKFYMNRWCDKNANMMMKKQRYHNRYKEIK